MGFFWFFHEVCKISNFYMWTAKHLAQASCTELTLLSVANLWLDEWVIYFIPSGNSTECTTKFRFKFKPESAYLLFFSKFSDQVSTFADSLNFWTCMVNIVNGTMSIGIVIFWCFTIVGSRSSWMKLRLVSCASLLASIFLVLAAVIFSTFFDQLVILEKDRGNNFTPIFPHFFR